MAVYDLTLFPEISRSPNFQDLTGKRFGLLAVVAYGGSRTANRFAQWFCRCDCGRWRITSSRELLRGDGNKSCGCQQYTGGRKNRKHGMCRTTEYQIWNLMRQRCENPNNPAFDRYGGRGITVCGRWTKFENFLADMGMRPKGLTLERIDNNAGYEPGNCKWATPIEQGSNKRNNKLLTFRNETHSIAEWGRRLGFPANRIKQRIRQGWTTERALTEPTKKDRRRNTDG